MAVLNNELREEIIEELATELEGNFGIILVEGDDPQENIEGLAGWLDSLGVEQGDVEDGETLQLAEASLEGDLTDHGDQDHLFDFLAGLARELAPPGYYFGGNPRFPGALGFFENR